MHLNDCIALLPGGDVTLLRDVLGKHASKCVLKVGPQQGINVEFGHRWDYDLIVQLGEAVYNASDEQFEFAMTSLLGGGKLLPSLLLLAMMLTSRGLYHERIAKWLLRGQNKDQVLSLATSIASPHNKWMVESRWERLHGTEQ